MTYGYALTNVGRFDIQTAFGPFHLEAVYGPSIYSDVDEKVVGVITVGGRLSCTLTFNEKVVPEGDALPLSVQKHLREAIGRDGEKGASIADEGAHEAE